MRLRLGRVSCHHPNHLFTRVSNTPPRIEAQIDRAVRAGVSSLRVVVLTLPVTPITRMLMVVFFAPVND
jgi:hypothetical protein